MAGSELDRLLNAGGFVMYQWPLNKATEATVKAAVAHFVQTYKRKPVLVVCHRSRVIKTKLVEVREPVPGEPKAGSRQIFVR